MFQRFCSRCGKVYETNAKHGKICDDCKLPNGNFRGKKNELV